MVSARWLGEEIIRGFKRGGAVVLHARVTAGPRKGASVAANCAESSAKRVREAMNRTGALPMTLTVLSWLDACLRSRDHGPMRSEQAPAW